MDELTCHKTSRRAYHSHATRIFNKVEETLATELDELAVTYLNTAVAQLEKKKSQIVALDEQIFALIEDTTELEEAILDSEELQDTITGKVNELNKRVELFQLPRTHPHTVIQQGSSEADKENVSDVPSSLLPSSSRDTPITTVTSGTLDSNTVHSTTMNVTSGSPVAFASRPNSTYDNHISHVTKTRSKGILFRFTYTTDIRMLVTFMVQAILP